MFNFLFIPLLSSQASARVSYHFSHVAYDNSSVAVVEQQVHWRQFDGHTQRPWHRLHIAAVGHVRQVQIFYVGVIGDGTVARYGRAGTGS